MYLIGKKIKRLGADLKSQLHLYKQFGNQISYRKQIEHKNIKKLKAKSRSIYLK